MSVSIYYSANRNQVLSEEENREISLIIEKYSHSYPYKNIEEDFCLYDYKLSKPEIIFSGCTKLPLSDNIQETFVAALHWAECLSEIRRFISTAQWFVNVDDTDMLWDEENGWHFPFE